MATFLTMVNDVLARMRESSVAANNSTAYSTLIGKYINDAKRQVEDAYDWNALLTTITVTTSSGTSTYTVTGSGLHARQVDLNDTTNKSTLQNAPLRWILDQQQLTTVTNAPPEYFAWNGNDATDSKIELFPTPAGTYTLKMNLIVPQAVLAADTTVISVPSEPVVAGAYARAIVERGEDGGLASSEAYALYRTVLADYIAMERSRYVEYDGWVAV